MSGFVDVSFSAGSHLFKAGEPADKMFIVKQGSVELLDSQTGQPFATLTAGQPFGEQAVLAGGVRSVLGAGQGRHRVHGIDRHRPATGFVQRVGYQPHCLSGSAAAALHGQPPAPKSLSGCFSACI